MNINVRIESTELVLRLRNGERRLAYATVNAINATAKQVQGAEHDNVRRKFIIRNAPFFFGSPARPGGAAARISPFASVGKARAYAEVSATPSTIAGKRRFLLPTFEAGGERKPFTPGAKRVAIPLEGRPARPSIRRGVPYQYTFAGLRFAAYRGGKKLRRRTTRSGNVTLHGEFGRVNLPESNAVQWKGRERTFILSSTARAPEGGVFQRVGRGDESIRMIYSFRRNIRIDHPRLGFVETARETADLWFHENMEREIVNAIARARGRTA